MNKKSYSVSIIIPARNEEGNIDKIIPSIPKFGKWQEVIFIEGNSQDKTWEKVVKVTNQATRPSLKLRRARQSGKGKADAVWQGLRMATGDILMVYDADRTVPDRELPKFFNALALHPNEHIFANGNRLKYPMEKGAMYALNKIGNIIFGKLFTSILGQTFNDTLCGTKVFWRADFKKFKRSKTDPFGDFDLIFGAIRNNLKVIEIPIHYKERVYGSTNINRFYHGLLLFKMTFLAYKEFKKT